MIIYLGGFLVWMTICDWNISLRVPSVVPIILILMCASLSPIPQSHEQNYIFGLLYLDGSCMWGVYIRTIHVNDTEYHQVQSGQGSASRCCYCCCHRCCSRRHHRRFFFSSLFIIVAIERKYIWHCQYESKSSHKCIQYANTCVPATCMRLQHFSVSHFRHKNYTCERVCVYVCVCCLWKIVDDCFVESGWASSEWINKSKTMFISMKGNLRIQFPWQWKPCALFFRLLSIQFRFAKNKSTHTHTHAYSCVRARIRSFASTANREFKTNGRIL